MVFTVRYWNGLRTIYLIVITKLKRLVLFHHGMETYEG